MASSYIFPGYPTFVEQASIELGLPDCPGTASRIMPLSSLANLCAQAAMGKPADAPGILSRATEFRHQLAVALRAADLMLVDVEAALDRSESAETPQRREEVGPVPFDSRKGRKGSSNPRERP